MLSRLEDDIQIYQRLSNQRRSSEIKYMENEHTVQEMKAGPLILKKLLHDSHIDTNATSIAIGTKVSNLDTHIATVGHDITEFNANVKK